MVLLADITGYSRAMLALSLSMANVETDLAKLVLGLHSLDYVLFLRVRSIPELGTHGDLVGET